MTADDALMRRVEAAIAHAGVDPHQMRADWPECHRKNCHWHHATPEFAFGTMKSQIMQSVRSEMECETTTRPDVSDGDTDDDPRLLAVYALATLLNRYNVNHAGTYVNAAHLIVDAYPGIVHALSPQQGDPEHG